MLISLIITSDFIEKTCQKEYKALEAFLKIILYEDPYIFVFKKSRHFSAVMVFKNSGLGG